jgi:alpha-L-rhamnosidase
MARTQSLAFLCLCIAALPPAAFSGAYTPLEPYDLRVDGIPGAMGIDTISPQFSWKLRAPPESRGARQSAWEIQSTLSSEDGLSGRFESAWSSGRMESALQSGITLAAPAFRSNARVFWRLRVWDEKGEPSDWSTPVTFTMGLLSASEWAPAEWITDPDLLRWKRGKLGYSSIPTDDLGASRWLQLDLGSVQKIDTVRLIAVRHTVLANLGFPRRYKLEASDEPSFVTSQVVADYTNMDHGSEGDLKVKIPAGGILARYIRLTFPHLRVDEGKARLAIGQVVVLSGTKDIAIGAAVTATDSLEDDQWSLASVVDGLEVPKANSRSNGTLRVRREFNVRAGLRRALLDVCGLGYCVARLNGKQIPTGLLTPGWTDYDKSVQYETQDVTSLLRTGANAAGLELAGGMYNVQSGGRYTKFYGPFRPLTAIALLRLEYADGTVQTVATDGAWRVAAGPTTFAGVYGGEDYDARRETPGWSEAGFNDRAWTPAVTGGAPKGVLRGASNASPPFAQFQVLRPASSRVVRPGVTVYDMGQNASLMLDLRVKGSSGSSVRVIPAELVHPDGTVDRESVGGGKAWWNYTLSGAEGGEDWRPSFFYQGCRYLQVECTPGADGAQLPSVGSIEGLVAHSNSPQSGEFECSDELFNRVHTLIRWAQQNNLAHVLTDCPTRERLGWLEQYDMNGPSLRYEWDLERLFRKSFLDMADSQLASGLVPDIAPEYAVFPGGFRDSPEWGSTIILAAWQQYVWYGDASLLRDHYPSMQRYVDYLAGRAHDSILNYGLGDWFDLGPNPPGVAQLTPVSLTATAIYFEDVSRLAQIAALLGKDADAQMYREKASRIRDAFNRAFFHPDDGTYASASETAQAMPLVAGLVPEGKQGAVLAALVRSLAANDYALTSGDVGYRYLLRALAAGGRSDLIFAMNHRSDRPGYGYQLEHGATSLTEAWDTNPRDSQDHFMLGQIMEWFYGDLAGLDPDPEGPGFARIILRPQPVAGITWARAREETPRGPVSVEWRQQAGVFTLMADVPANTTATVILPPSRVGTVLEGGKDASESPGVSGLVRLADGSTRLKVLSGRYEFQAQATSP